MSAHTINTAKRQGLSPSCLIVLALYLAIAGIVLMIAAHNTGQQLPDAGIVNFTPAPERLQALLDTAQKNDGKTSPTYTAVLEPADQQHFIRHFQAIAPSKGRYPHTPAGHSIEVVLPVEELTKMTSIAENPVTWTVRNAMAPNPPRGPSTLNLVNVRLETIGNTRTLRYKSMAIPAFILWVLETAAMITGMRKALKD